MIYFPCQRGDSSVLQLLRDQIEELIDVSQGLENVAGHIQDLDALRTVREAQSRELKEAFMCLVCRGIILVFLPYCKFVMNIVFSFCIMDMLLCCLGWGADSDILLCILCFCS